MANVDKQAIERDVGHILRDLAQAGGIGAGRIVVIGTSTSEVIGAAIGTSGTTEAAEAIFTAVRTISREIGFHAVFQCCEHLNRALVMERQLLLSHPEFEQVSVVPVPRAGGSMAAYAYRHMNDPVVVEAVQADAGIDIGETLIGMHLKRVAVPFRPSIRYVGHARVTTAFTRPKLIGGARAVYEVEEPAGSGSCD